MAGRSSLRKKIEIVVTRCHILKLKCTKFDFGRSAATGPAGGAYSAHTNPLAGYFYGERGEEKRSGKGEEK